MTRCNYCGHENEDSHTFCSDCGIDLHPEWVQADQSNSPPRYRSRWLAPVAWVGFGWGALGTAVSVAITMPAFGVASGQSIRPMGWGVMVLQIAAVTAVIGLPCSLLGLLSTRRFFAGIGVVLALCPYPVSVILLHLASSVRGFSLSP